MAFSFRSLLMIPGRRSGGNVRVVMSGAPGVTAAQVAAAAAAAVGGRACQVFDQDAAVTFVLFAEPDWAVVGLVALGSTLGGVLGARVGRRLPPGVLRGVIVVVGVTAIVNVVLR